jgi:hypothetical protein
MLLDVFKFNHGTQFLKNFGVGFLFYKMFKIVEL